MSVCKICGSPLKTAGAERRGCCDVPSFNSVEEQLDFWLAHDPEQVCVACAKTDCERRVPHA